MVGLFLTWRTLRLKVWKAYKSTHPQSRFLFPPNIYGFIISGIILLYGIPNFCGGVVELRISDSHVSLRTLDPKLKRGYFKSPLFHMYQDMEAGDVEPR